MKLQALQPNPNVPKPPKANLSMRHLVLYIVMGVLLVVVVIGSMFWWKEIKKSEESMAGVCVVGVDSPCNGPSYQSIPKGSATQTETAKWKTYANSQYGYKLQYPGNFSLKSNSDSSLSLSDEVNGENGYIQLGGLDIKKEGDLKSYQLKDYCSNNKNADFCRTKLAPNSDASYASSSKTVTFNGYNAIKFVLVGIGENSMYLVESPNHEVFSLRISDTTNGLDPKGSAEFQDQLSQILSSFKFVDSTGTMDISKWKTYTNTQYGFSFKYPPQDSYEVSTFTSGLNLYVGASPDANGPNYPDDYSSLSVTVTAYTRPLTDAEMAGVATCGQSDETVQVGVDKITANFCTSETNIGPTFTTLVMNKNKTILYTFISTLEDKATYNQILSTFKFTK